LVVVVVAGSAVVVWEVAEVAAGADAAEFELVLDDELPPQLAKAMAANAIVLSTARFIKRTPISLENFGLQGTRHPCRRFVSPLPTGGHNNASAGSAVEAG
jgi:hypothetical protein